MIRTVPEPGDIGLTSIEGAAGWGIRLGQRLLGDGMLPYEHAFLVLDQGELIEAEPGGAKIRPLAEYDGRHVLYVAPTSLTDEQRAAIVAAGRQLEGVPYSGLDYLAIALHRFHIPAPGLRQYIADTGHLICSALCDLAYQRGGVQLFNDHRWNGYVVPADLYRLLGQLEVSANTVVFLPELRVTSETADQFREAFEANRDGGEEGQHA